LFLRLISIVDQAAINHTQISRRHNDLINHAQTKLIPLVKQDWMSKPNKDEKDALQQYYTDLVNRSLEEEQKEKQLQHPIKLHQSDFAFLTKEASKKASRLKGYVKEDVIKKTKKYLDGKGLMNLSKDGTPLFQIPEELEKVINDPDQFRIHVINIAHDLCLGKKIPIEESVFELIRNDIYQVFKSRLENMIKIQDSMKNHQKSS